MKIGFFKTDSELIFQDEVHGNLFIQVEKTMDLLLTKYLKANINYEKLTRIETYDFPENALREALLNALIHKDYASANPIQISVYADKLLIWNAGALPENWSIQTLKEKHPSLPSNPDIANTFFRAGYIEAWGRGTINIMEQCEKAGLPEPDYEDKWGGVGIMFKKLISKTSGKILTLIQEKKHITIPELAELIGVSQRSIERNLKILQANKKLTRVGPARGGYWEIIQ